MLKFLFQDAAGKPSLRKIIAFVFIVLAFVEKAKLVFWSHWHFSVALHARGVSDAVVIALITSLDAIAVLCLAVYGIKKTDTPPDAPTAPPTPPETSAPTQPAGEID
jgi:hypothetical protein